MMFCNVLYLWLFAFLSGGFGEMDMSERNLSPVTKRLVYKSSIVEDLLCKIIKRKYGEDPFYNVTY